MNVAFLSTELPRWDQLLREDGPRPGVLGLPFFEDERPLRGAAGLCDWRLGGRLSRLLGSGGPARLRGDLGERLLTPTGTRLPWGRLVLYGLGPSRVFDDALARHASRELLETLRDLTPGEANGLATLALVAPGRSTGLRSARQALELLLAEAAEVLDPARYRLAVLESPAGQKEAAELARRLT